MTDTRPALSPASTKRLVLALCSTVSIIFVLEILSHWLVSRFLAPLAWASPLADSTLLAILALPALYYFVIVPLGRHSAGRAVSDRTLAEEAEARLATILEATPDLVSIADLEGRLLYMNRAGRAMVGSRTERPHASTPRWRGRLNALNGNIFVLTERPWIQK